jgi:RNA polymerase sigma factor (sigma-70 family)
MNEALMHQRNAKHRHTDSLEDLLPRFTSDGMHERLEVDYSDAADVESTLDHDDLAEAIREAVARLPETYRVAFVLCDLEDMTAVEAAKVLTIKPATVRQRVHRARLMLRGFLGQLAGSERS